MAGPSDLTLAFEAERAFLRGLAYRMLGSVTEAEDIVQDAWLRWQAHERTAVQNARAFLARIVTNLCLDHLASARVQREHYVGQWLPEPLVDVAPAGNDPARVFELEADVSFALLQLLERLSPLERAAFLLHDVFDFNFTAVAQTLGRSEVACRQLAARARQQVQDERPRYRVSVAVGERLRAAFMQAVAAGDIGALASALVEDVGFYSDGGGKVSAVSRPLHGAIQVARVVIGFAGLYEPGEVDLESVWMNGHPGFILRTKDGAVLQTIILAPAVDDRIAALYVQRNPDKLRHLAARRDASPAPDHKD